MASVQDRQLGALIRAKRESLGITQQEMADELGLSPSGYGHYERGQNAISAVDLQRIALKLQTTPNYLLGWGDERSRDLEELAAFYRGKPPALRAQVKAVLRALVEAEPDPV